MALPGRTRSNSVLKRTESSHEDDMFGFLDPQMHWLESDVPMTRGRRASLLLSRTSSVDKSAFGRTSSFGRTDSSSFLFRRPSSSALSRVPSLRTPAAKTGSVSFKPPSPSNEGWMKGLPLRRVESIPPSEEKDEIARASSSHTITRTTSGDTDQPVPFLSPRDRRRSSIRLGASTKDRRRSSVRFDAQFQELCEAPTPRGPAGAVGDDGFAVPTPRNAGSRSIRIEHWGIPPSTGSHVEHQEDVSVAPAAEAEGGGEHRPRARRGSLMPNWMMEEAPVAAEAPPSLVTSDVSEENILPAPRRRSNSIFRTPSGAVSTESYGLDILLNAACGADAPQHTAPNLLPPASTFTNLIPLTPAPLTHVASIAAQVGQGQYGSPTYAASYADMPPMSCLGHQPPLSFGSQQIAAPAAAQVVSHVHTRTQFGSAGGTGPPHVDNSAAFDPKTYEAARASAKAQGGQRSGGEEEEGRGQTPTRQSKGGKPRSRKNKKPMFWTPEDHEKFLQGLEKFGMTDCLGPGGAELISLFMGNRSVLQVKSHAQKYFHDLAMGKAAAPLSK